MPERITKKPSEAGSQTVSDRPLVSRRRERCPDQRVERTFSLASEIGLRIVRGDYPPGTILPNEAKWSETFDVSRSAVREAIKMLMAKSLLASRPKIGSWVEPKERWNLLDRDVLAWYATSPNREPFPAARCRSSATSSSRKRLHWPPSADRRADGRDQPGSPGHGQATSLQERTQADTRFHLAILRASGNDLLVPLGVLIEWR